MTRQQCVSLSCSVETPFSHLILIYLLSRCLSYMYYDWSFLISVVSIVNGIVFFFFSSRRRHTRFDCDWSSDVCSSDLFDVIRDLFSKTQEARARGYKPGRFSFNVKGGRCEVCRGDGQIKIEMHFLPDVYVPCEQCGGKRYNRETLDIRFKGKTIADVLDMPVEEAVVFFQHIPKIRRRLETLNDVGLGYIRLGQPATTLSGGEAQRVKLATELSKVATGSTLYFLDEPTTGLHFADVQRLLEVLH